MIKKHLMSMLCLGFILAVTVGNICAQGETLNLETIGNDIEERSKLESKDLKPKQTQLTVYPNPALNSVRINSENEINLLAISDKDGRHLYSLSLPGIKEVDISNLQGGMYFITAQTSEGILKSQFIKL